MYLKLFQRKTKINPRVDALAKRLQGLAEQVCNARADLKPDDVIKSAQNIAGKWSLDIVYILESAVANAYAKLPLPWEV